MKTNVNYWRHLTPIEGNERILLVTVVTFKVVEILFVHNFFFILHKFLFHIKFHLTFPALSITLLKSFSDTLPLPRSNGFG